jgi:lysophospholipase L1-like esterase
VLTLLTFGDSVLDCAHYNSAGLTPGRLLVHNDDLRFPEFRGQDLQSLTPTRLEQRARDGAAVADLKYQLRGLDVTGPALALVSIGGNDLLWSMSTGIRPDPTQFARELETFLEALPVRPVLVATIYDPTFGDDLRAFLGVDPGPMRAAHARFNAALASAAARVGQLADLHAHFLRGTPGWFVQTIEPSLVGASEIRRCFWPAARRAALELTVS